MNFVRAEKACREFKILLPMNVHFCLLIFGQIARRKFPARALQREDLICFSEQNQLFGISEWEIVRARRTLKAANESVEIRFKEKQM